MRIAHLPLISVALMLVASAAAYTFLPATMTIHWNLWLQPDGYAEKRFAVLVLPAIALLILAMQLIGRTVTEESAAGIRFSQAVVVAVPILLVAHLFVIGSALVASGRF